MANVQVLQAQLLQCCQSLISESLLVALLKSPSTNVNINRGRFSREIPLHCSVRSWHNNSGLTTKLLLEHGADVNIVNDVGETALYQCLGNPAAVSFLLQNGADITQVRTNGESTLYHVAQLGAKAKKSVDLLLDHGKHLDNSYLRSYYELLDHILACNLKELDRILLSLGDVDFAGVEGESPLHFAVLTNNPKIVKMILNHGADVHQHFYLKRIPLLHVAVRQGNLEIVKLMLERNADIESVKVSPKGSLTPICVAAACGNEEILDLLLERGANVNGLVKTVGNVHGYPPLHSAVDNNQLHCAKLLLMGGAQTDCPDINGDAPLHVAVCKRNADLVELLLKHCANPNVRNREGRTPLHHVLYFDNRGASQRMLELLLSYNASVYARDYDGKTPLQYAAEVVSKYGLTYKFKPFELLLDRSALAANEIRINEENLDCAFLYSILRRGADLKMITETNENTSVACLCEEKECQVFVHLIKLQLLGYETDDNVTYTKDLSYRKVRKLTAKCREEIEKMKELLVSESPSRTLFDLIFFKRNQLARFSVNDIFLKLYKNSSDDFEKQFPIYGDLLNLMMARGRERCNLMCLARQMLDTMTGANVPYDCGERIFGYFKNMELVDLSEKCELKLF